LTEPLYDLMCEPWCWHPDQIAKLTDYQVLSIRDAQNRRVEAAMKSDKGNTAKAPPPAPTENVRSGAAYQYLIDSGMSPEQAERVIRSS